MSIPLLDWKPPKGGGWASGHEKELRKVQITLGGGNGKRNADNIRSDLVGVNQRNFAHRLVL